MGSPPGATERNLLHVLQAPRFQSPNLDPPVELEGQVRAEPLEVLRRVGLPPDDALRPLADNPPSLANLVHGFAQDEPVI